MSTTNPPHRHQVLAMRWATAKPLANPAALINYAARGLSLVPAATVGAVTLPNAVRWRLYTPHSLHHVVAQEIDRLFVPMIPAPWTPVGGLPAFSIACGVHGAQAFTYPGRPQAQLDADVAAVSPTNLADGIKAHRDGNEPDLFFADEAGLNEHVASGRAVFTCYLLDALMLSSAGLLMVLKDTLGLPRPNDPVWSQPTAPTLAVPQHRSFPGGHAMQLAVLLEVLSDVMRLAPAQKQSLGRSFQQVSDARRGAGVHTQHENDQGALIGGWMAGCLSLAAAQPAAHPRWAALVELARAEW